MIPDAIHGILGLARRAGALISGTETVLNHIRNKRALLVIIADDASENTKKTIINKCGYYDVMLIERYTADELNKAVGKSGHKVFAVTNRSFAETIINRIEKTD